MKCRCGQRPLRASNRQKVSSSALTRTQFSLWKIEDTIPPLLKRASERSTPTTRRPGYKPASSRVLCPVPQPESSNSGWWSSRVPDFSSCRYTSSVGRCSGWDHGVRRCRRTHFSKDGWTPVWLLRTSPGLSIPLLDSDCFNVPATRFFATHRLSLKHHWT